MQNYKDSKRKKLAIRFFTYGVMTLATVVISLVCILLALGYRFDSVHRSVEQGGLYQFRSFPSGAAITLDGQTLSFRTPGKYTVAAGQHAVTMAKPGYQTWRTTSRLKAGELRWLNYARLVPATITTRTDKTMPTISDMLPSPDRRWLALLGAADTPELTVVDIRTPEKPVYSTVAVPETALSRHEGQTSRFSLVEWDLGGRYLLLRHDQSDGSREFIRLDRTVPAAAVNLTSLFGLDIAAVHFSGTSGAMLYGLAGGEIRRLDTASATAGPALAQRVLAFELYKTTTIAYLAQHDDKRVLGVTKDGKDTIVRSYAVDAAVSFDISSYFDHTYVAASAGPVTEIIRDPLENTDTAGRAFATMRTAEAPGWLMFASSGRFMVVGRAASFTTYDLETDETFSGRLDGGDAPEATELGWLDDYYLTSTIGGKLTIGEFDGANQHTISAVKPLLPVTLSENGEYLFSIGTSPAGDTLQASGMIIKGN